MLSAIDWMRKNPWLPLGFMIVLGVGVRAWAAAQWPFNFDSDEAIFGLMAKDLLAGIYSPTVYGTEHLGSLESILAAPLLRLFGDGVPVLRAPAVALFGFFLLAHVLLVKRAWGAPAAFVSSIPLAIPGFYVLAWTYQPIGAYLVLLLAGTMTLLLAEPLLLGKTLPLWRSLALGVVVGVGLWSNQMYVVYAGTVVVAGALQSEAWAGARDRIGAAWEGLVGLPFREITPVAMLAVGFLFVLAFFTGGCHPVWQYEKVQTLARWGLVILGVAGIGLLAAFSEDRLRMAVHGLLLVTGGLVGYAPQWVPWWLSSEGPVPVVRASCPTDTISHLQLLAQKMLPAMWGLPTWQEMRSVGALPILLWLAAGAVVWLGVVLFLWIHRRSLWRAFSLRSLKHDEVQAVLWSVLFLGPVVLSALASNTVDIHSIRHLLVSWQAGGVLLGVVADRLARRRSRWLLIALALVLAAVGVQNMRSTPSRWLVKFTAYEPGEVGQLGRILHEESVEAAYADYWGAFTLTYLLDEPVVVAPHNGIDRIPRYTAAAGQADPVAVIQPRAWAGDLEDLDDLLASLAEENVASGEGAAREGVRQGLSGGMLLERREVGPWVVWLIDPSPAPVSETSS